MLLYYEKLLQSMQKIKQFSSMKLIKIICRGHVQKVTYCRLQALVPCLKREQVTKSVRPWRCNIQHKKQNHNL